MEKSFDMVGNRCYEVELIFFRKKKPTKNQNQTVKNWSTFQNNSSTILFLSLYFKRP